MTIRKVVKRLNRTLKELRVTRGFTMLQVATQSGISEAMYCQIENGKRRPSPEVAKRLGEILGFCWTRFYDDTPINCAKKAV